jgi:hypothetical protein
MAEIKIDSDDQLKLPEGFAKETAEKAKKFTLSDAPRKNHSAKVNLQEESDALDDLFENEVIPYIERTFKEKKK